MANGGKDIKFGDDKRPVSIVPNTEQFLYNKSSGQFLRDEFGNRLVTQVDTYFIADSTMAKATSVAFLDEDDKYATTDFSTIGIALTALCGNYEVVTGLFGTDSTVNVKQTNGTLVGVGTVVTTVNSNDSDVIWYDGNSATGLSASRETYTQRDPSICSEWPVIRTIEEQNGPRNKLYFDNPIIGVPDTIGSESGGSNYTPGTHENVATTVSPYGGSGLTVDIVVGSDGEIDTYTIRNTGFGYSVLDQISVTGGTPPASGNFAIASIKTIHGGISKLGLNLSDRLSSDSSDVAVSAASTQYINIGRDHIMSGTKITEVSHNYRVVLNNELNIEGPTVGVRHNTSVNIRRGKAITRKSDATWKVEEQFPVTSEVSSTLLGVNRAETQLSLFSNVSSYGIDSDEFEIFDWNVSNYSVPQWNERQNKTYGSRYNTRTLELTEESGIQIGSYPVPYSFPFGPKWERFSAYDETKYSAYKKFIQLGNDLYDIYSTDEAPYNTYPSDWKNNFLNKDITKVSETAPYEVVYTAGLSQSFAHIDTWTDTWIKLEKSELVDPVADLVRNFSDINDIIKTYNENKSTNYYTVSGDATWSSESLPGYDSVTRSFTQMQSRRVFRYQPGRISGFTFGVKASDEPRSGFFNEWGISNPTDEYMFRIRSGQLYIIRRSSIPLGKDLLKKNGLKENAEVKVKDDISGLRATGNPFRNESEHYVTEISTDFFNGDPLNGRGLSEYNIAPSKVTMWKIEFGWYGAIGARFYAYIPVGSGEARWVVIHTLVIENQLQEPCLRDSYFRMAYRLNVIDSSTFREPQQITKYGASYYIDGGDEGTTTIYSVDSSETKINGLGEESLLAIRPKDKISNSLGTEIKNKKMIIPTQLSVTTGALTKLSTVVCKGCPGFGYVYTPGVEVTANNGREIDPSGTVGAGNRSGIIFTSESEMEFEGTD